MTEFRIYLDARTADWINREATQQTINACLSEYNFFCERGLKTDRNFDTDLMSGNEEQFQQRCWEIKIGNHFARKGFNVTSPTEGPDFRVTLQDGKTIWVEAIVPNSGRGENAIPEYEIVSADEEPVVNSIDKNAILKRWTHAFDTKNRLFRERYCALVGENDGFVIAISGALLTPFKIDGFEGHSRFPMAFDAVYGTGNYTLTIDRQTLRTVSTHIDQRNNIYTTSGASIPVTPFLADDFSYITGIIASSDSIFESHIGFNSGMIFIHNNNASIRIDRGVLQMNDEFWIEQGVDDSIQIRQLSQLQEAA